MKNLVIINLLIFAVISSVKSQVNDVVNYYDTIQVGVEKHDNGDYKSAILEYLKVPDSDSNYVVAVTEAIYSYNKMEEYEDAIKLGKKIINQDYDYDPGFILNLGSVYDNAKKYGEAINLYKKALEKYPLNSKIYYNMGYSYLLKEDYENAFESFKTAAEINPAYGKPHLQLASLAINEGQTTLAILALNYYLTLVPNGNFSNTVLSNLNNICSSKYKDGIEKKDLKLTENSDYSEIDLLVENYLALDKKYKVASKIQLPYVKQTHLVFEKISELEASNDFWYRMYIPTFKKIFKENKFEIYSYYITQSSGSEKHQKIIKSKETKIKEFLNWLIPVIDQSHRKYYLDFPDLKNKDLVAYRANYGFAVSTIGHEDNNGKYTGWVEDFYASGALKNKVFYNNENEKEGESLSFFENGLISEKDYYKNGVLQDSLIVFNKYGRKSVFYTIKNDSLNGKIIYYYNSGAKSSEFIVKNKKREGLKKDYYEVGKIFSILNYVDNQAQGQYISYYNTGEKQEVAIYKDDKLNGVDTIFYRTGKIQTIKHFKDGKLDGDYVDYYENGKIKNKGKYLNGNIIGTFITYTEDGIKDSETNYDETGKKNGIYTEFYEDGKPYFELEYKKGEAISYKYYNKDGSIMAEAKRKMGSFMFEGHHKNGKISSKGEYGKEEHQGKWEYFDKNGTLYLVENYKDGILNGELHRYYPNGEKESDEFYKDGKDYGIYRKYSVLQKLERIGYFFNGNAIGQWKYFYPNGDLKETKYFLNDNIHGYNYVYAPNGKLFRKTKFEESVITQEWFYDSLGTVTDSVFFVNGTGEMVKHFKNNQIHFKYNVINNGIQGLYTEYYPNGKIQNKGNYYAGRKNGKWIAYYPNGNIMSEENYEFGEETGLWKYYYPNGKIKKEKNYKHGELNGKYVLYFDNGKKKMECTYKNGDKTGEGKYYTYSGEYEHSRFYDEGVLVAYSYKTASGTKKIDIDNETANVKIYFDNGKLAREFSLEKGWFQGKYKKYFKNGNIFEEFNYKNNEYDGDYKTYYQNGQLKSVFPYKYGVVEGIVTKYFENGKIKETYENLHGYIHGNRKIYDKTGKLIHHYIYYYGDIIEIIK